MKRLLLVALVVLAILVVNLLIVRRETAYKTRLNEAVASVTPGTIKDGVVLSCKVLALQHREDYPDIIKHKSVPEIRDIVLAQPASC